MSGNKISAEGTRRRCGQGSARLLYKAIPVSKDQCDRFTCASPWLIPYIPIQTAPQWLPAPLSSQLTTLISHAVPHDLGGYRLQRRLPLSLRQRFIRQSGCRQVRVGTGVRRRDYVRAERVAASKDLLPRGTRKVGENIRNWRRLEWTQDAGADCNVWPRLGLRDGQVSARRRHGRKRRREVGSEQVYSGICARP